MTLISSWRAPVALALIAAPLSGCDWTTPKVPGAEQRAAQRKLADARRLKKACGSAETYDRLKALTFEEANRLRRGGDPVLDRVEASTTLRMENPVASSRDETLDVTVCRGSLVLDLPPGVEDAFNGGNHLRADIEYAAQAAADGSGLVYRMKGAEPIIYRLAALTLPRGAQQPQVATVAATAEPPAAPADQIATREDVAPAPPRPPLPQPEPRRPREVAPPAEAPRTPSPPLTRRPAPPPVVTAAPASMGAQPSFNCARVTGRVLRLICADPALAAQDRRMSSMFYQTLASGDDQTRAALRSTRDRFLAFRDRCPTAACVAQAYSDRMAEIRDIGGGG